MAAELSGHSLKRTSGTSSKSFNYSATYSETAWREKIFTVLNLLRGAVIDGENERKQLRDCLDSGLKFLHSRQDSMDISRLGVFEDIEQVAILDAMTYDSYFL